MRAALQVYSKQREKPKINLKKNVISFALVARTFVGSSSLYLSLSLGKLIVVVAANANATTDWTTTAAAVSDENQFRCNNNTFTAFWSAFRCYALHNYAHKHSHTPNNNWNCRLFINPCIICLFTRYAFVCRKPIQVYVDRIEKFLAIYNDNMWWLNDSIRSKRTVLQNWIWLQRQHWPRRQFEIVHTILIENCQSYVLFHHIPANRFNVFYFINKHLLFLYLLLKSIQVHDFKNLLRTFWFWI